MNFFPRKIHLSAGMGCILFFTVSTEAGTKKIKRSVLIEDDDVKLLEIMKDDSIKDWGFKRPGEKIHVPNGVKLKLCNESDDEPMILIEKNNPDLPIVIDHQESVRITESETGDLGYEKTNAEGEVKLITNAENYNKLHSDAEPTEPDPENTSNNDEKKAPNYTQIRTITKLPPRNDAPCDWDELNSNSVPELSTKTNECSWWVGPLVSGSLLTLGTIGLYYLSKTAARCTRYLLKDDLWSSWKPEESYDTLLMMQPKYLANDLIKDINVIYYQEANPIKLFLRNIQEERETILGWMQFRDIIRRFGLPLGREYDKMEKRLMLLELMRKTVHYWRAQELSKERTI